MLKRKEDVLESILEHCLKLQRYSALPGEMESKTKRAQETFDELRYDGIVTQLTQIGELVKGLPADFTERTTSIVPWHKIRGLRNIIVHDYNALNFNLIDSVIKNDIPVLEELCCQELGFTQEQEFCEDEEQEPEGPGIGF